MERKGYANDGGKASDSCFATKTIKEQVSKYEKVVDKVHSILKSLNIPTPHNDYELNDLHYTIYDFSDSLKRNCISNSNLNDNLNRVTIMNEERRIRIEALEVELNRYRDDIIFLKRDSRALLKQRNIFV